MPHREIPKEISRGTITRDHWNATVTVMCSDRLPPDAASPLFLDISWRRRRDEEAEPPLPDDAQPTQLVFTAGTGASGEVHWDEEGERDRRGFPGDFRGLLKVFAGRASAGERPDLNLVVIVDGDERAEVPLAVGNSATALRVRAENGEDGAPELVLAGEPVRFKAVPEPPTAGAFRWISVAREALPIRSGGDSDTVEVEARADGGAGDERILCVYFAPQRAEDEPPQGVMAVHRLRALDLDRLFEENRVVRRHLDDIAYRRRLEAMTPAEVEALLARAVDAPVQEYLRRLLEFVREQQPLREAPEGDREAITFIMGAGDDFYGAANVFFEHWRDQDPDRRTLVTDLRTLVAVRNFLAHNRPDGGRWGEVNIVVHANEEGGMSIPVLPLEPGQDPEVHQANPRTLQEAVANGDFDPLPDGRLDVRSTIRVRGCALGRSREMLETLSKAFGGDEPQRPVVRAPKELQAYEFRRRNGVVVFRDEYLIEFWFVGFPEGQRPNNPELVVMFRDEFAPDPPVDWAGALGRADPRPNVVGDPYHVTRTRTYTFTRLYLPTPNTQAGLRRVLRDAFDDFDTWRNVRETGRVNNPNGTVRIEVDFEQDGVDRNAWVETGAPNLSNNDAAIRAWLAGEDGWQDDFRRLGHEIADYTWSRRIANVGDDVAIIATGRRTIVRVQRELTEPDPGNPGQRRRAHPPVTDLTYFGEEVPVREPEHPPGENVPVPAQ